MTLSTTFRTSSAVAAVTALGLSAAGALLAEAGAAAATPVPTRSTAVGPALALSAAASPGRWTVIAPNVGISTTTPRIVRFGGVEEVVWTAHGTHADGTTSDTVAARQLTFAGTTAGLTSTVAGAWDTAFFSPALISLGGRRTVVFAGYRRTHGTTAYDTSRVFAAQSTDGGTWTLAPGALAASTDLPGDSGLDATSVGGRPVTAFVGGSSSSILWHAGLDPFTAITADHQTAPLGSCCVMHPSIAQDSRTGQVWTTFYEDGATAGSNGYFAARLLPTATRPVKLPISSAGATSVIPNQRIPLTARVGGGLWTAYRVGYPSPTRIRLQNVETGQSLTIGTGANVDEVGLTAGPAGRLWVFWRGDDATIRAVRSNAAVTAVGPIRAVTVPGRAGYVSVYQLDGEGSTGPLTLVANTNVLSSNAYRLLATQILPALRLVPGKARVARGQRFGVKVTDAGAPVSGAIVGFGGVTGTTNAAGLAFLTVPARRAVGRAVLTATLGGYFAATGAVTVTR